MEPVKEVNALERTQKDKVKPWKKDQPENQMKANKYRDTKDEDLLNSTLL